MVGMGRLAGLIAIVVACPVVLPAQGPVLQPAPGQRVRVEREAGPLLTGNVVAWSGDTVRIQAEATREVTAVPRGSILRYEASAGRDRWRGARRGAFIGGVLGAAVVAAGVASDLSCDECFVPISVFAVPAGVALTLIGTGVGAMIGTERWEPAPASGATALPGRMRLGLAIRS
jgi:hypothetical protein